MLLFAYPPFSNFLIENLEDKYVKYNYSNNVKYIHVLGSGHIVDKSQPISSLINDGGIKRVVEGVIIHKNIPNSKLIFTGYSNKTDISNASMNAKLAMALGVSSENIIISELEKDTKDESIFVKSIVGSERFVLVTSATHMTRSLKLFKEIGLKPIPAPTDFKKNKTSSYFQFPSISALEETRIAIHEYLGLLWNKMKKKENIK